MTDFLTEYFKKIMDYNFTAQAEEMLDTIAAGESVWQESISAFYTPFHKTVENTLEVSERKTGERILGEDPKTGKPVSVRIGRFGPIAQIGTSEDEESPRFASLKKNQSIETITIEEALELFKFPRELGEFEEKSVTVGLGRFGPYVRHNNKFVSLKKGIDDPLSVTLERAIELILEKREADNNKIIKTFANDEELQILNGRYGPYIAYKKKNYKIPKKQVPEELSYEDCLSLIEGQKKKKK